MGGAIMLHLPRPGRSKPVDPGQGAQGMKPVQLQGLFKWRGGFMADLILVLCGVAFFAGAIGYTLTCERL